MSNANLKRSVFVAWFSFFNFIYLLLT